MYSREIAATHISGTNTHRDSTKDVRKSREKKSANAGEGKRHAVPELAVANELGEREQPSRTTRNRRLAETASARPAPPTAAAQQNPSPSAEGPARAGNYTCSATLGAVRNPDRERAEPTELGIHLRERSRVVGERRFSAAFSPRSPGFFIARARCDVAESRRAVRFPRRSADLFPPPRGTTCNRVCKITNILRDRYRRIHCFTSPRWRQKFHALSALHKRFETVNGSSAVNDHARQSSEIPDRSAEMSVALKNEFLERAIASPRATCL